MREQYKAVGSFSTLGLEIVLCVMLGFFGGRWVDAKLHTEPYLAVIGFFFGLAAAANGVRRALNEMKAIDAREEREEGNPPPKYVPPNAKADDWNDGDPADRRGPDDTEAPMSPPSPGDDDRRR